MTAKIGDLIRITDASSYMWENGDIFEVVELHSHLSGVTVRGGDYIPAGTFEVIPNHYTNQQAHDDITEQFTRFKRIGTDRRSRIDFSNRLTERYLAVNDKIPPVVVLDRLATLILQDELADKDRMKMRNNEYPLLSDTQDTYRKEDERSMKAAQDVATDGLDYRIKSRDSNRRMRECFG